MYSTLMYVRGEASSDQVQCELATEAPPFSSDLRQIALDALAKGEEVYLYQYDMSDRSNALRALGRAFSDPETSFTERDGVVVSRAILGVEEFKKRA